MLSFQKILIPILAGVDTGGVIAVQCAANVDIVRYIPYSIFTMTSAGVITTSIDDANTVANFKPMPYYLCKGLVAVSPFYWCGGMQDFQVYNAAQAFYVQDTILTLANLNIAIAASRAFLVCFVPYQSAIEIGN